MGKSLTLILGGVRSTARGFSARLQSEREAERQSQMVGLLLRDFEEHSTDVLWEIDRHGRFTHVSARLAQLLGVKPGEQPAELMAELGRLAPDMEQADGLPFLRKALAQDKPFRDLALAIHKYVHEPAIRQNSEELFARMVFNIFVSNDDDHLRNHAFVRDPRSKGWALSPLYDVVPRPSVAHDRLLHLNVGDRGKLATLDNVMTQFGAFTADRRSALHIIRNIWSEVRQWKTSFEDHGSPGALIETLDSAFRSLQDIASPGLEAEIRHCR